MAIMEKQTILIIDDEQGIRESLSIMLQMEGYDTASSENAQKAMEKIENGEVFDFIVCDIKMPGMSGLEFLREVRERNIDSVIIMITAYGNHETSIEAIKKGADDYITKPVKTEELVLRMKMAEEKRNLRNYNLHLRKELSKSEYFNDFISVSREISELKELAIKASLYNTTVLITGESGTGKELLAKSIHRSSSRKDNPFLAVNCAAIPDTLLESELFGFAKGSFSGASDLKIGLFENASGGTLFLDEIAEIPVHLQPKLLRVLQEQEIRRIGENGSRKIDVRVIAASNKDLGSEVEAGNFRSDLYYRLNVLPLRIPPLRERRDDIPELVRYFVDRFNKKLNRNIKGFSSEAMNGIIKHPWYGNVRELENFVERSMIFADSDIINDIALPSLENAKKFSIESWIDTLSLEQAKSRIEEEYIKRALEKTNGNRSRAAEYLGISRRNLLYKIKEYLSGKDTETPG